MGYPGEIRSIAGTGQTAICHHEDCTNPSQWRVQGETDSFGAEYEYFCADHIEDIRAELKQAAYREDHCEGCNKLAVLRPTRDWEEGNNGPFYYWCADCRDRNRRNLDDLYPEDNEE